MIRKVDQRIIIAGAVAGLLLVALVGYLVLISPVDEEQAYSAAFQHALASIRFAG